MSKSKTDQKGQGSILHLVGSLLSLSILGIVRWYVDSLRLRSKDFLFPRFRGGKSGSVVHIGIKAVSYGMSEADLKMFLMN